jgi:hypothetical protein
MHRIKFAHHLFIANQIKFNLNFLRNGRHDDASLLQAERLRALAATGESRRAEAASRGKEVFQLEKICRDLLIPLDSLNTESEIISAVSSRITEIREEVPIEVVTNPPKILEGYQLSESQRELLSQIGEAVHQVEQLGGSII